MAKERKRPRELVMQAGILEVPRLPPLLPTMRLPKEPLKGAKM